MQPDAGVAHPGPAHQKLCHHSILDEFYHDVNFDAPLPAPGMSDLKPQFFLWWSLPLGEVIIFF